jgi:lysophospholipase L1-like esterase
MTRYYSRPFMLGAVLIAALALPFSSSAADSSYYLSLGDSLAAGYQPDPKVSFDQGYADQLFTKLQAKNSSLKLKKLGCYTDESTNAMINGGACSYPKGSQLNQAVHFLQTHSVALITIDIGANDVLPCFAITGIDTTCVTRGLTSIQQNLPIILHALHIAAPGVPIVGMNYYDPYLAIWLLGDGGLAFAKETAKLVLTLNDTLEQTYIAARSPVADVEGAFSTTHFTPKVQTDFGTIPLNVALICQWTWMCDPTNINATFGIDAYIHPNTTGYGVIRDAFYQVLPHPVRN